MIKLGFVSERALQANLYVHPEAFKLHGRWRRCVFGCLYGYLGVPSDWWFGVFDALSLNLTGAQGVIDYAKLYTRRDLRP